MSFREKVAWGSLVAHGLILLGFGGALVQSWSSRAIDAQASTVFILGAMIALVTVGAVAALVASRSTPADEQGHADEREEAIAARSDRVAHAVLLIGVVLSIGALLREWDGVQVANGLVLALVLAGLVRSASALSLFRGAI